MNRLFVVSSRTAVPRQWNRLVVGHDRSRVMLQRFCVQQSHFSTIPPPAASLSTLRTSILKSALDQVHQLGWTDEALAAATASVREQNKNVSMSVVGMMTVDDLIGFCMDQWNLQLKVDLKPQTNEKEEEANDNTPKTTMDPLEKGIKTRLSYLIPFLQSNRWHEGMALGVRGPSNAMQTQRQLQEMVDIIVASSPHTNLGTPQRMALGAVYVATELHLLADTSPGYRDTWAFLSHRMDDWRRLTCSGGGSGKAGDALFVASTVASSLAGGLISLVLNPTPGGVFGLPQGVWTSLFQNPQASWSDRQAGTHPDDYKVPTPSSSSEASADIKN